MSKIHEVDISQVRMVAGPGMVSVAGPDDAFSIEPPVNGLPFSIDAGGYSIRGQATVAEVRPCVFVFTIYEGEHNSGLATHRMVASVKPESPQVERLRAHAVPPTERDEASYQGWLLATTRDAMDSAAVVPWS